ncbi:MAG: glycosyltransferase [Frankiales bacterium]|nr:glycosyltransferase [Frankiales bacterium]
MTLAANGSIDRVAIVVPAHNEEVLLDACLQSLDRAAASVPVPVHVCIVLDSCTDGSMDVVAAFAPRWLASIDALDVTHRSVGASRAAGADFVLGRFAVSGLWLANTDADSEVPVNWIGRQLLHAGDGAQAVVGTVVVEDWSMHSTEVRRTYLSRYRFTPGHRHTHGANLSMTAAAYVRAGGFRDLRTSEDVALVESLLAEGQSVVWAADVPVLTSARRIGRAPHGFADHLLSLVPGDRCAERMTLGDAPATPTERAI